MCIGCEIMELLSEVIEESNRETAEALQAVEYIGRLTEEELIQGLGGNADALECAFNEVCYEMAGNDMTPPTWTEWLQRNYRINMLFAQRQRNAEAPMLN